MRLKRTVWSTAVSIAIAVLGIASPIFWERYQSRTALELQHLGTTTLASTSQGLEKLAILYDSKHIPNLSKDSFALVNSGRRSIRGEDIFSNPAVTFGEQTQVLELLLEGTFPRGIQCSPSIDGSRRRVEIGFPLLNPGDRIEFSVLTTGLSPEFGASARIAGVGELAITDRTRDPMGWVRRIRASVYLVFGFTCLCLAVVVVAVISLGSEWHLEQLLKRGVIRLPPGASREEARAFVNDVFRPAKVEDELKPVLAVLETFPAEGSLGSSQRSTLAEALQRVASTYSTTLGFLAIFGILAIIGITYVFGSLLAVLQP